MTHEVDLSSTEGAEVAEVALLPEGAALGTWGTYSTAGTASCPVSSAGTAMTAS
jgi:hypothetical protein